MGSNTRSELSPSLTRSRTALRSSDWKIRQLNTWQNSSKTKWVARCPKRNSVIFDPGTEFKGAFRDTLTRLGIEPHPTAVKNPQANSICERLHQSVAEVIRATVHEDPPEHRGIASTIVDDALATAAHAARTALCSTLGLSSGALVFHRDMLLDMQVVADWESLQHKRRQTAKRNLDAANRARVKCWKHS